MARNRLFFTSLRSDSFYSHMFVFMIGTGLTGMLNQLYQLIMGRMLGPEQYGLLGALFGLIYLVQIMSSTITTVVSAEVSALVARKKKSEAVHIVRIMLKRHAWWALLALVIFLFLAPVFASFLHTDAYWSIVMIFLLGYISLIAPILTGVLNGLHRFTAQSIATFVGTCFKLLLAILFVWLGWSVFGAITGVVISAVIGGALTWWLVRRFLSSSTIVVPVHGTYRYALPVLFGTMCVTAFLTVDVIFARHVMSPIDAGLYNALSSLGKIIWFGAGFTTSVMFPKVSSSAARGKKTGWFLWRTLGLSALLGGAGVMLYFIAPYFLVQFLYGSAFAAVAPYIGWFGIGVMLFVLNTIFMQYHLALRRINHIWFVLMFLLLEIGGFFLFPSFAGFVRVVIMVNILTFMTYIIYSLQDLMGSSLP